MVMWTSDGKLEYVNVARWKWTEERSKILRQQYSIEMKKKRECVTKVNGELFCSNESSRACFSEFYKLVMSEYEQKIKQIEQRQQMIDFGKCQTVVSNNNLEGIFEKFQTELSTFKSEFTSH